MTGWKRARDEIIYNGLSEHVTVEVEPEPGMPSTAESVVEQQTWVLSGNRLEVALQATILMRLIMDQVVPEWTSIKKVCSTVIIYVILYA